MRSQIPAELEPETLGTQFPVTTRSTFPEREISESLGIVRGNSVRARNLGRDLTQAFRDLVGGELKAYSQLMADTREEAFDRMVEQATVLEADGVVEVRFETVQIVGGAVELLAYGTAVRFR